jgi:hypothetical protein
MHLTLLTYGVGLVFLITLGPSFVHYIRSGTPLLSPLLLLALLIISGLDLHQTLYMNVVLTENRNPFLPLALVTGLGIVLSSVWLTPHYGVLGLLMAQGGVSALGYYWWPVLRGANGLGGPSYWKIFFRRST